MEILDAGTRAWTGLPPRGMEYWERLDDVIQREPIEPRDIFFHAMLRPLGLEKGKPFKPDARQTKILTEAALVGEAMAKGQLGGPPLRGGKISIRRTLGLRASAGRRRSQWILEPARRTRVLVLRGRWRRGGDGTQTPWPFIRISRRIQGQSR
jgi:hypothetical protein